MPKDNGLFPTARRLHRDDEGAVLLWFTAMLFAIFAVIGLAIDGSAYMNLNASQQKVADAAALAGANELDGASDALTRATAAATSLANNANRWSNASGGSAIANVYFYMTLADVNSDSRTTSTKAAYIKVITDTRSYKGIFIRAVTRQSTVSTKASAVAVSQFVICAPVQSFMCNPFEADVSNVPGTAKSFLSSSGAKVGDMFKLVQGSGGSPGDWGLIQPPGTSGNPNKNQPPWWAALGTSACTAYGPGAYTLTTSPGNTADSAVPGQNVRFDTPANITDVDSTSAPIVISGFKVDGNTKNYTCNRNTVSATPTVGSLSYSQTNPCTNIGKGDSNDCLVEQTAASTKYINYCSAGTGSCPFPRDRKFRKLGDGSTWGSMIQGSGPNAADLDAYWANHHAGPRPSNLTTRYLIYKAEVDGTAPFTQASETNEPSRPQCEKSLPPTGTTVGIDRRLLNVAIIDCNYFSMSGRSDIPTTTLTAKFFMTEPAQSDGTIYSELVNVLLPNGNGSPVHHIVKLVQ